MLRSSFSRVRRVVSWGCVISGLLPDWLASPARAQSEPTYAGRPFVRIAQSGTTDPVAGFISGFGRAQMAGDQVAFAALSGISASGVFRGRGGPLEKVAAAGTVGPDGAFLTFHDGFVRGTGASSELVFAAGGSQADGLYLADGTGVSRLLAPGTVLPDSGGLLANTLGEPNWIGGSLAVIAWHRVGVSDGVSFRGVYRVQDGQLQVVADTVTELPGGFGVPDTFSSQVGFDGQTLAFWASRGPFGETEGMFVREADGGLRKIAQNGDSFPGGGVIDGFFSPPVVADGEVYFFAYSGLFEARLLRYSAGSLTVLARDGDATPDGGQLESLGQFGLAVEGSRVFFAARTPQGPGVYVLEDGVLKTVIAAGAVIGGLRPVAMVLQDVADDTVVVDVSSSVVRRLVANVPAPAAPVIVLGPAQQTVAAGDRVELRVSALGDPPLTYLWHRGGVLLGGATSDTLVIPSAAAADVGYYRVMVTNRFGSATAPEVLLNVEAAPVISAEPSDVALEEGDQLVLRVTAVGGLPLSYRWLKNGEVAVNDSPVAGVFSRRTASAADAGQYSVVVSNAFGAVTSQTVTVVVAPAGPNPAYGGRRWAPILDASTMAPDLEVDFDLSGLTELSARWWGARPVFVGVAAGNVPLGVFAWEPTGLTVVLAPNEVIPGELEIAEGYQLIQAQADQPLAVRALQTVNGFLQPVGLYRLGNDGLELVVDTTTPIPGQDGASFPIFHGDAIQAGGSLLFMATTPVGPAAFLADSTGLKLVLSAADDLPVVGRAAKQFQNFAFDGERWVIVAATTGLQQMVALRGAPGEVPRGLIAREDPLPGTSATVRSFGPAAIDGEEVFLTVYSPSFAQHVLHFRGDLAPTLVAGPGMAIEGLGSLQSIESVSRELVGGRMLLSVVAATAEGVRRGVVAAGPEGIEPVLFTSKLDGQRISGAYVADADGDRMILLVLFESGAKAIYANVGEPEAAPLRLEFVRPDPVTLRLTVPSGARLESARSVGGPWEEMVGEGEVGVPATEATRFYRLRQP